MAKTRCEPKHSDETAKLEQTELESISAFSYDIPSEDFGLSGLLLENIVRNCFRPYLGLVFRILELDARIMVVS